MPLATVSPEPEDEDDDLVEQPVVEQEEEEEIETPEPASLEDDSDAAPPVQPPDQAVPASTERHQSILDRIREITGQDLSAKYRTEEDALRGLVHASQRLSQRDEYASLGQQFAPYVNEFQEYLQRRSQTPEQPQPQSQQPKGNEPWWNPPQWDERWTKYLVKDQRTGETALDPKTPYDVARKIEAWQEYHENWISRFRTNPAEALSGFENSIVQKVRQDQDLRRTVLQDVYNLLGQWETHRASHNTAQQIVGQNQEWLYQRDKSGKVLYEPDGYGRSLPMYTPQGAAYVQEVAALTQQGVADPVTLDKYARMAVKERFGSLVPKGQPAAPRAPKPQPEVPAGSREIPQSSAATPKAPKKSTKGLTLRERMQEAVKHIDEKEFVEA